MRIALMSDLHANLEALETCLRHARGQGVGRFAFLGDLVGYGADPAAVVDRVAEMAQQGAWVLKGNHDEAIARDDASLTDEALAVIAWSRERLSADQRAFLAGLPTVVTDEDLSLVHASADAPLEWRYVRDESTAGRCLAAAEGVWCAVGHVHEQRLYYQGAGRSLMAFAPTPGSSIPVGRHRRWLMVVGSVGQPRDGSTAAAYAVLDTDRATLTFYRVPYDHAAAASKIRAAGLPETFARRLEGRA